MFLTLVLTILEGLELRGNRIELSCLPPQTYIIGKIESGLWSKNTTVCSTVLFNIQLETTTSRQLIFSGPLGILLADSLYAHKSEKEACCSVLQVLLLFFHQLYVNLNLSVGKLICRFQLPRLGLFSIQNKLLIKKICLKRTLLILWHKVYVSCLQIAAEKSHRTKKCFFWAVHVKYISTEENNCIFSDAENCHCFFA